MTPEQYYWTRRQQILRAYNLQQQKAPGGFGKYNVKTLKSNLKEVWFDDFIEQFDIIPDDSATQLFGKSFGACSSVRRGKFHGRNFDFTFDPRTTHVVHVKANEQKSRHAFAGIAKASFNDDIPDMMKMPNLLKDGINDHNVVVNINVVSKKDLDDVGLNNTETNPAVDKRVHCDCVPSYILAYANSAADAINIMKNKINIYGYLKGASEEANEYLHYMISDPNNTFVVEIIRNELFVIGYDFNTDNDKVKNIVNQMQVDPIVFPHPIMTNWYLNYESLPLAAIKADGKYTQYGCGIERFKVLNDNYDSAESVFELMKLAKYKNACEKKPEDENFPFSDLIGRSTVQGGKVVDYYDYMNFRYGDIVLKDIIDSERQKMNDAFANNKRNLGVWLTSHNTVYDIENKTFTLVFEEDYDNVMNFSL